MFSLTSFKGKRTIYILGALTVYQFTHLPVTCMASLCSISKTSISLKQVSLKQVFLKLIKVTAKLLTYTTVLIERLSCSRIVRRLYSHVGSFFCMVTCLNPKTVCIALCYSHKAYATLTAPFLGCIESPYPLLMCSLHANIQNICMQHVEPLQAHDLRYMAIIDEG